MSDEHEPAVQNPGWYEFVNIMDLVNLSGIKGSDANGYSPYCAGTQLDLLADVLPAVEWIVREMDDDYSGDWYAVFIHEGRWYLLNGCFGSCSGCDDLEGTSPIEWIENNVKNVRVFTSCSAATRWLAEDDEWTWTGIRETVIDKMLGFKCDPLTGFSRAARQGVKEKI